MPRRPIIAGNWKMNKTVAEAKELVNEFIPLVNGVGDVDIVLCPPATALQFVTSAVKDTNIDVGSQNVHWEDSGAFTGEIAPPMLKELGVKYAIIGHSERREYFGETDEGVNKRARAALKADIIPIICVGESLETREKGDYLGFVAGQVKAALNGFSNEEIGKLVIAYEPIWAIGTGKTATFEQAEEVCAHIRKIVADIADKSAADAIRIQYGGSVKPATIAGLMEKENVDGALVGGAALKANDFSQIVKFKG
ncbi:MAG: triose-phosphate isomerase [Schwartzia sp.]|nr:triose-phosphate isomerase [Schwartzia sp. (in: firmicutes)]